MDKTIEKKVLEILENDKINPLQSDKLQGIIQINNTIYDLFETKMQSILNTVFQISELSENEKQVLSFFSVLPSIEIIAEDLCLLFSISENEEIDFFNTLNSLSNKGWLIRRSNQYKIHASIQLIVKSQLTISENLKNKFTNSLIDILFISLTYNPIQKDKYIPFGETFISISKKITFEIAILLNNLAEIIRYTGDFEKSQKYYENAILFFESEPEKYLTELSILYNNIATLLRYKGEFLKAIEYLNKSIEISFKQSIISNTLIFKNNIATAYRYLGNFAMSLKHHNFIIDEILKNKTTDYNLVNVLFNNYQNTFRYFGLKNSEKNIELKNFVKNSDFWLPHKKLSLGLSIFSEIIKTRNRDLEFIEPRYKWDTRASYKQSPFFRHAPVHSSSWDNDDINEDSLNFLWLETSALVEYFINQHNKANFFINEAFVQVKNIEQKPNNEDYEELLNWKRKINEISLNWQKNIEKENI